MTGQTNGNNSLKRTDIIDCTQLRQDAYFESLLQMAYQAGIISDSGLQRIQMECLELLAEKTKMFTSGSSSVRIEDAENIMKSNLYIISLFLKSMPDIHDALEAIKTKSIADMYALGQKRIKIFYASTLYLYRCVLKNMVGVDCYYYFSTLTKSMEAFFSSYTDYYMLYSAHELPGEILFSYPLCNPGQLVDDFIGIEYVRYYLQMVYYENVFCKNFTDEAILTVLLDYNKDYSNLIFNIFEKVLIKAIGCTIVGEDVMPLYIPDSRLEMLRDVFTNAAGDEKKQIISDACQRMIGELGLQNNAVRDYVKGAVLKLLL